MRTTMHISLRRAINLSTLAIVALLSTACGKNSTSDSTTIPGGDQITCVDPDGDGYGNGCILGTDCEEGNPAVSNQCAKCSNHEEGCPCSNAGQRIECGIVKTHDKATNSVSCGYGGQVCESGKWSACQLGGYAPGHDGYTTIKSYGAPTTCVGNPCDPYCKTIVDQADPTMAADSGLIYVPDAGLSLEGGLPFLADAATPEDLAKLAEAGVLPDASLIFHELLPGQEATDPVEILDTRVRNADIYFLLDDTASMREESAALTSSLAGTDGIIARLRAPASLGSDAAFGFGRFEEFATNPYTVAASDDNVPYQHLLNIQASDTIAQSVTSWLRTDAYGSAGTGIFRSGGTIPESTVPALWALATGNGLYRSTTAGSLWHTPPHVTGFWQWAPPTSTRAGNLDTITGQTDAPCPTDAQTGLPGFGYPCFRPRSTPVVVLITDAPAHNGPAGQYGYMRNVDRVTGAVQYTTTATVQTSNNDTTTAVDIPTIADATTGALGLAFGLYSGTVPGTLASRYDVNGTTIGFTNSAGTGPGTAGDYNGRNGLRDCVSQARSCMSTTDCDLGWTCVSGTCKVSVCSYNETCTNLTGASPAAGFRELPGTTGDRAILVRDQTATLNCGNSIAGGQVQSCGSADGTFPPTSDLFWTNQNLPQAPNTAPLLNYPGNTASGFLPYSTVNQVLDGSQMAYVPLANGDSVSVQFNITNPSPFPTYDTSTTPAQVFNDYNAAALAVGANYQTGTQLWAGQRLRVYGTSLGSTNGPQVTNLGIRGNWTDQWAAGTTIVPSAGTIQQSTAIPLATNVTTVQPGQRAVVEMTNTSANADVVYNVSLVPAAADTLRPPTVTPAAGTGSQLYRDATSVSIPGVSPFAGTPSLTLAPGELAVMSIANDGYGGISSASAGAGWSGAGLPLPAPSMNIHATAANQYFTVPPYSTLTMSYSIAAMTTDVQGGDTNLTVPSLTLAGNRVNIPAGNSFTLTKGALATSAFATARWTFDTQQAGPFAADATNDPMGITGIEISSNNRWMNNPLTSATIQGTTANKDSVSIGDRIVYTATYDETPPTIVGGTATPWPSPGNSLPTEPTAGLNAGGTVTSTSGELVKVCLNLTSAPLPAATAGGSTATYNGLWVNKSIPVGTFFTPSTPGYDSAAPSPVVVKAGDTVTFTLRHNLYNGSPRSKMVAQLLTAPTGAETASATNRCVATADTAVNGTCTFVATQSGTVFWGVQNVGGLYDGSQSVDVNLAITTPPGQARLYVQAGGTVSTGSGTAGNVVSTNLATPDCVTVVSTGSVTWGVLRVSGDSTNPKVVITTERLNPPVGVTMRGAVLSSSGTTVDMVSGSPGANYCTKSRGAPAPGMTAGMITLRCGITVDATIAALAGYADPFNALFGVTRTAIPAGTNYPNVTINARVRRPANTLDLMISKTNFVANTNYSCTTPAPTTSAAFTGSAIICCSTSGGACVLPVESGGPTTYYYAWKRKSGLAAGPPTLSATWFPTDKAAPRADLYYRVGTPLPSTTTALPADVFTSQFPASGTSTVTYNNNTASTVNVYWGATRATGSTSGNPTVTISGVNNRTADSASLCIKNGSTPTSSTDCGVGTITHTAGTAVPTVTIPATASGGTYFFTASRTNGPGKPAVTDGPYPKVRIYGSRTLPANNLQARLYGRSGSAPTTGVYDCRSVVTGYSGNTLGNPSTVRCIFDNGTAAPITYFWGVERVNGTVGQTTVSTRTRIDTPYTVQFQTQTTASLSVLPGSWTTQGTLAFFSGSNGVAPTGSNLDQTTLNFNQYDSTFQSNDNAIWYRFVRTDNNGTFGSPNITVNRHLLDEKPPTITAYAQLGGVPVPGTCSNSGGGCIPGGAGIGYVNNNNVVSGPNGTTIGNSLTMSMSYTNTSGSAQNYYFGVRRWFGNVDDPRKLTLNATIQKRALDTTNPCTAGKIWVPASAQCCTCAAGFTAGASSGSINNQCCRTDYSCSTGPGGANAGYEELDYCGRTTGKCVKFDTAVGVNGCPVGSQVKTSNTCRCESQFCSDCGSDNCSAPSAPDPNLPPGYNTGLICTPNDLCAAQCAGSAQRCDPTGSPTGTPYCCTLSATSTCTALPTTPKPGGGRAEAVYKFSVPAGKTLYYHFGLLTQAQTSTVLTPVVGTDPNTFLYMVKGSDLNATRSQDVLDCNAHAERFNVNASNGTTDGAFTRSELNGKVTAGAAAETYYVFVDNLNVGATTTYKYLLQVGVYPEDTNTATPSYAAMIDKLNAKQIKVVGVDSSGTRCGQANLANIAQYETYDFLDRVGRDTQSVDENGNPFVVSVRNNATDCAGTGNTDGLKDAIVAGVTNLSKFLRQDVVARAVPPGVAASDPAVVLPASLAVAQQFIKSVQIVANASPTPGTWENDIAYIQSRCLPLTPGYPDGFGADTYPNAHLPVGTDMMFRKCAAGTNLKFKITFQVPTSIVRTSVDQYFRFDVITVGNGNGELSRTPVVIKVPRADYATPASFVRVYNSDDMACPPSTRAVWKGLFWDTSTPIETYPVSSNVKFYASANDAVAALEASERLFGEAHRTSVPATVPANTEVAYGDILAKLLESPAQVPTAQYLRVRMELNPTPDKSYVPILKSWSIQYSCAPAE
ncbi:MAG: hypothetical protein U0169_17265 [Polyangiaceae bacterium]